jgi:nitric oxide reductase subunit B
MMTYDTVFSIRRLWVILAASMVVMFGTLLYFGGEIYQAAPPIPAAVRSAGGTTLFTQADIERGQNVWQSTGGMQQGSIWGHGSYVAPDWSADWLHREALALLDSFARSSGAASYGELPAPDQARLRSLLQQTMRTNTFDAASGVVTVSEERARAIATVGAHFSDLFEGRSAEARSLREDYAFPIDAVLTSEEAGALNAFFFWTAWAASTERPGNTITYTSNWPHEPLVGNTPTGAIFMWTFVSILVLLAGAGALIWYYAKEFDIWRRDGEPETGFARADFMATAPVTASMRVTSWYFGIVTLLFVAQVLLGIVTAHYAVEDRRGMARYRPVRRPALRRPRAETASRRRLVSTRKPRRHRRRFVHRRMARDQSHD